MKTLQITLIALFTACFVSCGDNQAAEDVAANMVENFKRIPDVIKDVSDVESAKVASEKLSEIGKDINAVLIANKDKQITKSKSEEIQKTMTDQLTSVKEAIQTKITDLSAKNPAAAMELSKGFQSLVTNMTKGVN